MRSRIIRIPDWLILARCMTRWSHPIAFCRRLGGCLRGSWASASGFTILRPITMTMPAAGTDLGTDMLGRRSTDPVSEVFAANRSVFTAGLGFSAGMSILALTTSIYMLQVYDRVLTSRSEATLLLLTLMALIGISVFAVLDSL